MHHHTSFHLRELPAGHAELCSLSTWNFWTGEVAGRERTLEQCIVREKWRLYLSGSLLVPLGLVHSSPSNCYGSPSGRHDLIPCWWCREISPCSVIVHLPLNMEEGHRPGGTLERAGHQEGVREWGCTMFVAQCRGLFDTKMNITKQNSWFISPNQTDSLLPHSPSHLRNCHNCLQCETLGKPTQV